MPRVTAITKPGLYLGTPDEATSADLAALTGFSAMFLNATGSTPLKMLETHRPLRDDRGSS